MTTDTVVRARSQWASTGLGPGGTVVAAIVLVAGLVQSFVGAVAVGVTWDEPTHVERTQGLLDDGWFVPDWDLVDGQPDQTSPYVYGPAFSMTAHAANLLAGHEQPGQTSMAADAYRVRHLTVATVGLLGVLAAGLAAFALSGSRRIGLVAAAALVAIPDWTGHSMFNIKDVPAAAGYTLVTAGLVLALAPAGRPPRGWVRHVLVGAAVALGVFFGVGTRLALWVPVGASVASFLVLWALQRARGSPDGAPGAARGSLASVGAGGVAGTLGIVSLYPQAFARPVELLVESVFDSSGFPWDGVTLTAGQLLPSLDLPWWYLPVWFAAVLPILLGLLAVVGLAVVVQRAVRGDEVPYRGGVSSYDAGVPVHGSDAVADDAAGAPHAPVAGQRSLLDRLADGGSGLLVAQQALLLPIAAIVTSSVMYDGIRQHLYVLPALAVLVGLAVHRLAGAGSPQPNGDHAPTGDGPTNGDPALNGKGATDGDHASTGGRAPHGNGSMATRRRTLVVSALAIAALVVPTAEQALLFPYSYIYVNAAAGIGGVGDRWETDYWKASAREAVTRVPEDAELQCSALLRMNQTDGPFPGPCIDDVTTFEHERGTDVADDADPDAGVWIIGRRTDGNRPPDACEQVDDVTRWLRGEQVVVSYVVVCDPDEL